MRDYIQKVVPMYMGKIGFKYNKEFLKVYAYLIYTESGQIFLLDTGLNKMFVTEKNKILQNLSFFIEVDVKKEEFLGDKLKQYGLQKKELQAVICSHLHFDHAGGIAEFENTSVRLLVQKREYEEAKKLADGRSFEYKEEDFACLEKSENLVLLESKFLVDGNEMMQCLETYGHSAGHQSLLLQGRHKNMLLTGDVAYTRKQLDEGKISVTPFRKQEALESMAKIQELAKQCSYVICGHECDAYAEQEILL